MLTETFENISRNSNVEDILKSQSFPSPKQRNDMEIICTVGKSH